MGADDKGNLQDHFKAASLRYEPHLPRIFNILPIFESLKKKPGASLVAQWLRVRLPMQGTWVGALAWEDPACRGATEPVGHSY
ncbi:hypothetical protein J1605_009754 [Eschrichtius robustus]|uniref:Uncharacterized protein n=1 Tax=Eschrichtius robustus TaxID=9764 RepID=A0AB34GRS3_ESCRO|nr:hypothetical protein J1605_009754 [Eschrichtius robustus]